MVKPMQYRKLLKDAGYVSRQGKGDHEVWSLGAETVVITQTPRTVSPGLTRKPLQSIERSKEER